ncbi:hypothetical protein Q5A_012315 [Serratia inhibens PRI-2C]|nr:hypothetical protein Q5A_012315 [Serratia inhibens PRI-2C]
MLVLGFVTKSALADWQNVPPYLPHFQFYERHRTVISTAYPEKILPIIAAYDIQQDVIIKTLMSIRQLPQKLRRHKSESASVPFGLHSFTLLENSPTELCYGLRGQFWRTDFGLEDVPDISAYCAALPPGNAKLLLRYQVQQLAPDEYALCTETFIHCPDRATQLKMAGYWLAIRAGSGWIRQRTLKAVKLALEKTANSV